MKKQVGIWIRVSTEDQAKGESPEHHEARARMYAEVKNWEVVEIYHLEAVSGKTVLHHPEAERMIKDIKSGKITGLIFSKIARLARNTRELLQIADIFRDYNADLISLQESIDTSTPAGRFFYTLISAMAQWEREEIAERVSASVPIRAKLGKSLGGQAPYGYNWKDKKLIINDQEASIRNLMYDLFLTHKRKKTVANILNESGYRTRNNERFSDTTVKRLLEDPIAKGLRRVNYTESTGDKKHWKMKAKEEWVFNEVPPIISEEKWETVNAILLDQSKSRKQPLNKKTHLFTGFVICGCGSKMYLPSNNLKYVCQNCKNKIPQDDLEEIFHQQLTDYIITDENIQLYIEANETLIKNKEDILRTLRKETEKIQAKLDNLLDLHQKKEIPTEGFGHQFNPLFEQLNQIQSQIPLIEGEILALKQNGESGKYMFKEAENIYSQWSRLSRDEKRTIIESVTDSIIVQTEDITINLKYLMPPSYRSATDGQRMNRDSWPLQAGNLPGIRRKTGRGRW
ncbi:MAG: recombinase family protein [Bacteroidales bacterium]|nr:recombinase family protein [Bacteroidales bacterium]